MPPTATSKPPPPASRPPATNNSVAKSVAPRYGKLPATFQPLRIVLNAVEGFGKTTLLSYAEKPLIIMASGETGYETLLGANLVPSIDAAKTSTWGETLALVDDLIAKDSGHKTYGFDALGGFERQCHAEVCRRDFDGDWGEKGFTSFQKGYSLSVNDWLQLLARLDRLRLERSATIVLLSHCKVTTFKNPLGPDYDRWVSDVHDKTWGVTAKWADFVGFGNFVSVIEGGKTGDKARKGKGIGGTDRIIYCERRDAFDAKNRLGIKDAIDIPDDPAQSWPTLWAALTSNGEQS